MSIVDAAIAVMREKAAPMRPDDVMALILAQELWHGNGKTPAASLTARMCVDVKKHRDVSVFVCVAPGVFGLRELGAVAMERTPPDSTNPMELDAKDGAVPGMPYEEEANKVSRIVEKQFEIERLVKRVANRYGLSDPSKRRIRDAMSGLQSLVQEGVS